MGPKVHDRPWVVFCLMMEPGRPLMDLMVGSVLEMSINNVYDINNRAVESCCRLVSLGTVLLAQPGYLKRLKGLQLPTAIACRRFWIPD